MGKLINEILLYKEEESKLTKEEKTKLESYFGQICLNQIKKSSKSFLMRTIDSINEIDS